MVDYPEKPIHHPNYHPGAEMTDVVNYGRIADVMEGSPTHKHLAQEFRHIHEERKR